MQTSKFLLMFILGFGVFVLTVGVFRGEQSIHTYLKLKDSKQTLEHVTRMIEEKNLFLKGEILKIEKSPSYARRTLRDKYHLTEDGERIIFYAD